MPPGQMEGPRGPRQVFDLRRSLASSAPGSAAICLPLPDVDEIIGLMTQGKILPYLDIPFQHASPRISKP